MKTYKPASPSEDLTAWLANRQGGTPGLLTPDLVALVQSGVAISLAGTDARGWPMVGSGVGCRVLLGNRLRVLCRLSGNRALIETLKAGGSLAATFSAARDHRSAQVKASRAEVVQSLSDDLPEMDRQAAILRAELVALGIPPGVARDYVAFDPADLVAVEFVAEHLFSQTPGPGAGVELK